MQTWSLNQGEIMPLSYSDAIAALTAPGQRFEIERINVRGIEVNAFRHAPPTMRELFDSARQRGEATFLVYEDERWSFGDVMASVDALGAALVHRYGVQRGDRVAIGMRNYPEWIVAFAAITSIGAVSVSLNAWWTEDELTFALGDSGATVLIADQERVDRSIRAARRLGVRVISVRTETTTDDVDRWTDVVVLGEPLPRVEIDPEDDATILYTSGTTGRPKGAVSTHRSIVQSLMSFACRGAVDVLRKPEGEPSHPFEPCYILIVPLFHVTGSTAVMLGCFAAGARLVIMYKWDAERALELIEREQVTNFIGVPTQSWDLLESPSFASRDTSSLISVGGGGAPAPPELVKRVANSFRVARPNLGYGMTETNAYGPGNNGADYLERPTSTGRGVPTLELEIRDTESVAVPIGELGEIWFKGPHLIRGYWNRPDATEETIVNGWLRSGDLGRVDEEGFVYVVDRAKDMVIRAGENVYCAEVEAAIYELPAVYEAAVFGVPHERLGEEVAAVVHLRHGEPLSVEDLQAHVRTRLANFKVPTIVRFSAEQLPRNASGKMLKRELRQQLIVGD
jgi:long-chain acyl-CoA synthetase